MICYIIILLEAIALWALWPKRLASLKVFLSFQIIFDIVGLILLASNLGRGCSFWYYYWVGRSLGLILQSLIIDQVLTESDEKVIGWVGTILVIALVLNTWLHIVGRVSIPTLMLSGVLINLAIALVAWIKSDNKLVITGMQLWLLVGLILGFNQLKSWYPTLLMIPLLFMIVFSRVWPLWDAVTWIGNRTWRFNLRPMQKSKFEVATFDKPSAKVVY